MMLKYREDVNGNPGAGEWFVTSGRLKDYPGAEALTVDDPLVTIIALVDTWQSKLEGANYHSMMDVPSNLVDTLTKHGVAEDTIKRVLWDIIDSGGWMN